MFIELKKEHIRFAALVMLIAIQLVMFGCATPVNKQNLDFNKLIQEERYDKVAIIFYFLGRDEEYKKNGYALEFYEKGLVFLTEHESRFHEKDRPRLNIIKAALLSRYFFCSIEKEDVNIVNSLSQYILENSHDEKAKKIVGNIDDDKQYILLKDCLIPVHLFYTGNFFQFESATIKLSALISNKKKQTSVLTSPWYYITDLMVDETFVSIFSEYSKMQKGNLSGASIIQKEMENLYENPLIKTLLWGGHTFGIATTERAMILGFGAYGYSLVGQYNKSQNLFIQAIECLDDQDHEVFHRIMLSMLYAGYADCYWIPKLNAINKDKEKDKGNDKHIQKIQDNLEKSEKILPDEFAIEYGDKLADPNLEYGINLAKSYRLLTKAKFEFKRKHYRDSFSNSEKSFQYLGLTSPKQLSIDAIYYSVLSAVEEKRWDDAERVCFNYQDLLTGFKGFESWKLFYAQSLVYENKGDIPRALELAKKSVSAVENFRWDRFLNFSQQVTFMEDKSLPYEQVINLLLKANMSGADREIQVFEYIERVKIHSLLLLSGKDEPFAKNVVKLDDLKNCLEADESLINLYTGKDYLITLIISKSIQPGQGLIYDRGLIKNDIDAQVNIIRSNMVYKEGNFNYKDKEIKKAGNNLFKSIFGPHYEKGWLPRGKKIYVVPHRQLSYLPWNALSVKQQNNGNDYVVDYFNISTLPCATALCKLKEHKTKIDTSVKKRNAFFIGPDICCRPEEITSLKPSGSWNVLTNEKANVGAALYELQNSDTVIFFTHATFDISAPYESYIRLSGQINKSCLSFKDIENVNINADFVVLAGCATGKVGRYSEMGSISQEEKFLDADDLLGLYKQMISKGVRNIVFSSVDETDKESTEMFLDDLVGQINNNFKSSDAFGQSVKKLKKHKHYNHPYYWGAYVLVGPF